MNKRLNLVAIRITHPDTDMVADPDPGPYRDTGKTCLGGGMHCSGVVTMLNTIAINILEHF